MLNPDGTIQASQDVGDGIVYGEVSLDEARRKSFAPNGPSEKLARRRPELYDNLTLHSYLWDPFEFHSLYDHRPLPAGRRSKVAAVQLAPQGGDHAGNYARIEGFLADLSSPPVNPEDSEAGRVDLVVFPEYALTGCPGPRDMDTPIMDADVLVWHRRLIDLARRYTLRLVIGYAEQSGEQTFSAAVIAGPDGIVAHYRKTHVCSADRVWCGSGIDRPPVVDLPLGRVGLLIGTDLNFPELPRSLAIEGCDLLVVPAGPGVASSFALGPTAMPLAPRSMIGPDPHHFHLARQRAFENNCYLAFASMAGPDGTGGSAIFGPSPASRVGETILGSDEGGIVMRTIDTVNLNAPDSRSAVVRTKPLVRMRQPRLYDSLQIAESK